jgi:AcrR family transcriptional regulator
VTDWRTRKKAATRRSIQEHALRLFVAQGYEATTVEEIAAAASVSHMTFFRYFPRKEDVVESDDYDPMLEELIASRPATEPPLTAVYAAVRAGLQAILPTDRAALLIRTRLVLRTPALRSRNWIAQDTTRDLFARALARRSGRTKPDFATTVQAAAAVAAFGAAITAWAEVDDGDLVALVDEAFAALTASTAARLG